MKRSCEFCLKPIPENCDHMVRLEKTFHPDCFKKLLQCESCQKYIVKEDTNEKLCLSCGWSMSIRKCDICKSKCENGIIESNKIICKRCQEDRERKATGMEKCRSCGKKFYPRHDPLNCHTHNMCLDCAVKDIHYTTEYVDSMF